MVCKGIDLARIRRIFFYFIGLALAFSLSEGAPHKKAYDLVIKSGFILDGTGNPWFRADIGIRNKKIAKIGLLDINQAKKSIDAQNLIVCPGFIDIHTHCDRELINHPTIDNYILRGVTTVIGGN